MLNETLYPHSITPHNTLSRCCQHVAGAMSALKPGKCRVFHLSIKPAKVKTVRMRTRIAPSSERCGLRCGHRRYRCSCPHGVCSRFFTWMRKFGRNESNRNNITFYENVLMLYAMKHNDTTIFKCAKHDGWKWNMDVSENCGNKKWCATQRTTLHLQMPCPERCQTKVM